MLHSLLSKTVLLSVAIGFALTLTGDAAAQRRGRMFGVGMAQLAASEQIQSELKMTDEQTASVAKINEELRAERRELMSSARDGGNLGEVMEKLQQVTVKAAGSLMEKLDESQQNRLTEIFIQANGAGSLANDHVIAKLGVSDEQRQKLKEARIENLEERRDAFQDSRDAAQEDRREIFEKVQESGHKRLMGILTDEQRDAFGKMTGEAIEIDYSQLRGRGGGGGRGGNRDRPQ